MLGALSRAPSRPLAGFRMATPGGLPGPSPTPRGSSAGPSSASSSGRHAATPGAPECETEEPTLFTPDEVRLLKLKTRLEVAIESKDFSRGAAL